ncbi:DUF418 domain-containing protein [Bacillus daqingensis]|uniref:DUF418 domain-containing protein n=1 Tax=Bacillus daqingensis TaxID=872396 RepID=A0ABV9NY40_9BACI
MRGVEQHERVETLDIIRGIALMGILLINVHIMTSLDFFKEAYGIQAQPETAFDNILAALIEFFVEGSFISTFSILFGIGFYLFMTRAEAKGWPERRLFVKRLLALGMFGLLHLIVFWVGDILLYYAVGGFFLLLFYKVKEKFLLVWSVLLLGLFFLFYSTQLLIPESFMKGMQATGYNVLEEAKAAYQLPFFSGAWWQFRFQEEVLLVLGQIPLLIPYVLGLFLFGFYAAKKEWFQRAAEKKLVFKRMLIGGLIAAVPFLALLIPMRMSETFFTDPGVIYQYDLLLRIGSLPLALVYISAITLYVTSRGAGPLLKRFGAMGRMALTNYLSHTVLIVLFIHISGLFDTLTVTGNVIVVLVVIALQLWWSPLILNRWQYGPMEALWRKLTYAGSIKKEKD